MFAKYLPATIFSPNVIRIPYRPSIWSLSENLRMTLKENDYKSRKQLCLTGKQFSSPRSLLWHRLVSLSCRQPLFTTVVMFFLLHPLVYGVSVVKYCQFTNGTYFITAPFFSFPWNQCYNDLFDLSNIGFCEPGSCSMERRVMVDTG